MRKRKDKRYIFVKFTSGSKTKVIKAKFVLGVIGPIINQTSIFIRDRYRPNYFLIFLSSSRHTQHQYMIMNSDHLYFSRPLDLLTYSVNHMTQRPEQCTSTIILSSDGKLKQCICQLSLKSSEDPKMVPGLSWWAKQQGDNNANKNNKRHFL